MIHSIRYIIAKKTLPWIFLLSVFGGGGLLYLGYQTVKNQVEKNHSNASLFFEENVDAVISSMQQQIKLIASNELIVNGLIDIEERNNYIPTYMRSTAIAGIENAQIGITDFEGNVIFSNSFYKEGSHDNNEWFEAVLENGESFLESRHNVISISEPVLYANYPEGAVFTNINSIELKPKLALKGFDGTIVLTDIDNYIVFSSDEEKYKTGSRLGAIEDWFVYKKEIFNGLNYYSTQSFSKAYQQLNLLILVLALSIALAFIGILLSIFVSARISSASFSNLIKTIEDIKFKKKSIDFSEEVVEAKKMRLSFESIMLELFESNAAQSRINAIINSLSELIVVVDLDGNIEQSNNTLLKMLKLHENISPGSLPEILQFNDINKCIDKTQAFEEYDCLYVSDNVRINIRWQRSFYYSEQDKLIGFIFVGSDITERMIVENELRIKNRAIEEAPNGIVISDATATDQPIVYVNPAFESMTGYKEYEVVGKNCRFLQGEATDLSKIRGMRDNIENQQPCTTQLLNYRKDGTTFWNQLIITPIHNEFGHLTHFLGMQTDVSSRVKYEQLLIEAKTKAEESAKMKAEFLANMSHEIRTPMNGVLGMLGLLMRDQLNAHQEHYAKLAIESAESLLSLINDILDFSKIEAGKLELETIEFDLIKMLYNFSDTNGFRVYEKGLEFILDIDPKLSQMVKGDPGRIQQILTNLVSNAVKFTKQGQIRLAVCARENDIVEFKVYDSGIGIPENKLATLFESFTQVDASTTREFGGTGLGLSIVKQLSHLMNGSVDVTSNLGHGSCFSVTVELVAIASQIPVEFEQNYQIILFVNNTQFAASFRKMLTDANAKVVLAANYDQCMEALNQHERIDMVLFDEFVLDIDGINNVPFLKKSLSQKNKHIPYFVEINNITQTLDPKKSVENGIDLNIVKPIKSFQTLDVIQNSILGKSSDVKTAAVAKVKQVINGQQHRILLVEDNAINQMVAQAILAEQGLKADLAADGVEALNMLNNAPDDASYDIVLMDCQMPEMDGYEASRAIRSGKGKVEHSNVPIIAMTANAMKGDKEKCLSAGMSDYIAKPIDAQQLQEKLEEYLK